MESRRNGPQLSSRHDDDDDDMLCWLMQLRSGHVTLLGAEFQPPNCPTVGLAGLGGLTLGSAPNF